MMPPRPAAGEIAAMLAQRVQALVAELLPHGRRDGPEWRCGSLAGEPGQSLAVRLIGARAGIWCDFASGDRGDALDLVAMVLYRGDKGQAIAWARRWLGLGDDDRGPRPAPPPRRAAPPVAAGAAEDPEAAAKRRRAIALFVEAVERVPGTPAGFYLDARGIRLAELGRQPRALRFHPTCWCVEAGRPLPAMLAAITGPDGEHAATHRTYLAQAPDGTWTKAPLGSPKKVLGPFVGGAIRLWRGSSGVPLAAAPAGETVALAEGVETALSVALACPELRVLAAVSLSNMARVVLPPAVETVILCADNDDAANEAAARALQRAIDRFLDEGREVRVARSPVGKDFNDALRRAEPAA